VSGRTARLFPGRESLPDELAADPAHPAWGFAIGRLLEEGDGDDLRWLNARRTPQQLASWIEGHGARGLSRRGRQFWSIVLLDVPAPCRAHPLWPLG
jgi:hypothetical protein